jgi:Tfp pilus assembly protein PilO
MIRHPIDGKSLVERYAPWLPLIALATLGMLGTVLVVPLPWTIREQRQRLQQIEMLLAARPKAVATRAALTEEVAALQNAAAEATRRIPREDPATQLLEDLRQLAQKYSLGGVELQALPEAQLRGCRCREVTLRASGDYADIARLLWEVENRDYLVEITRLQLDAPQERAPYPVEARFAVYFDSLFNDTRKGRIEP